MLIQPRGIGGGASAFVDLTDGPGTIEALKVPRGNAGATALEWYTPPDPFAWAADWVNAMDYGAAGVVTETTLAAQINSGSTSATITDASSYAIGYGMAIPGAGVAGVELVVILTNVVGNVVSWTGATSTTVAIGVTVYHDDTQALEDAVATTKQVYAGLGSFNTTRSIEITTDRQTIAGAGVFLNSWGFTRIIPRHDGIVFGLYASIGPALVGLSVYHPSTWAGSPPTTGAGVVIGTSSTAASGARLYNVYISRCYDGLIVRKGFNQQIERVVAAGWRYGIWHNTDIPYGGSKFSQVAGSGYGASGIGIYIDGGDWNLWEMVTAYGTLTAIECNSANGRVYGQKFSGVYLDDLNGVGFKLTKGAYDCFNNSFENIHILLKTTGNIGALIGAGVEHSRFSGGDFASINGHGIDDSGTRSVFNDIHLRNLADNTNSYDAFTLRSASVGAKITGCSGNYSRYGLVVESGVTYATIQGNDFRNNNTGAASIAAGVKATSIIKDNQGLTDYETSVASAPEKIGLRAIVAGAEYVAVGTSSSADWKQTTV